jgi:tetratricopeptide (TPR) repeat protein
MYPNVSRRSVLVASLVLTVATWTACTRTSVSGNTASSSSDDGKVPITTKSNDARAEYLQGRELSEKLLGQESLQHFDKAIALDPEFATAELARANNSPTAKEFFEHLNKAVSLADKTSNGEKLFILANEAAANGDNAKQKEDLDKLVADYPNDERARLNLGNYYFGQQEFNAAIEQYKKATDLAPNFSPAYNILGYAYKQQGDYADAEQAFKKYIELIPNDPNPHDSYAELLLKMGRFDDSIAQYRKALSIDPHFAPSHFGISADLMYMGKPALADAELQQMANQARNDGELRTAFFGMAVVAADSGEFNKAAQQMDKEFAVAEKKNDAANMAADLQAKGAILAQTPNLDLAKQQFDRSLQLIEGSSLSPEIKDNAKLLLHFNLAGLDLSKKDYAAAKLEAEEFSKGATLSKNPAQLKQAHELTGRIALAEKDYEKAIAELQQANLQDPRNLYRLSEAYQGKGDSTTAKELCTKAADFNSLPQLPYAFIRMKAQKMAAGKKA